MPKKPQQLAKLSRPRLYDALPRERLFAALDEKREHPAVWIAAPPGSGKTTLLAGYVEDRKLSCLWYQVDGGDSDPATFFYYLGLAEKARPGKPRPSLPLFTPEYLADAPGFARRYFRQLFARLDKRSVLVFDNFQELSSTSPVHQFIAVAIEEAPEGICIMILSRLDPERDYIRSTANGSLARMDWHQLNLTEDEAGAVLGTQLKLAPAAIRRIHQQSDGWAAGLRLLAEWVQRGGAIDEVGKSDSLQDIFDYFAGELFDRASGIDQRSLLQLSFLPRMPASMVERMTGSSKAVRLLEELYRVHLFVDRRSGSEHVYQFHALLGAFLRHRAAGVFGVAEGKHAAISAARLLEESGNPEDAVPLYLAGGDIESVTMLVLKEAKQLIAQGRWQVVIDWIISLPSPLASQNRWLQYWLGTARMAIDPGAARQILEQAFELASTVGDGKCEVEAAAAIIQTYVLQYTRFRPLDRWIAVLESRIDKEGGFLDGEAELRALSAFLVALAYRQPGHPRLPRIIDRVFELVQSDMDVNLRLVSAGYLCAYGVSTGPLQVAQRVLPVLLKMLDRPDVSASNAAWSWFIISWFYCICGDGPKGRNAVARVELIAGEEGLPYVRKFSAIIGAWIELYARNLDAAEVWLGRLEQVMDASHLYDIATFHGTRGFLYALRGQADLAYADGLKAVEIFDEAGSTMHQMTYRINLVLPLVQKGLFKEARNVIEDMHRIGRDSSAHWWRSALLAVEAYTGLREGNREAGLTALAESFAYGKRHGEDYGLSNWLQHLMPQLCAEAMAADIEVDYTVALIRRHGWTSPAPEIEDWPWPVKISTLGGFRVEVDGKQLSFTRKAPKKVLAVLKALVAFGGRGVPEQWLMDALWPDESGDAAHESLAVNLHRLRKLLVHTDVVRLSEGLIDLDPGKCWTDVRALEHRFIRFSERSTPEAEENAKFLLDLYRGHFLPEEFDTPWTVSMRERLRSQFLDYLSRIARRHESAERLENAILLYRKGIESDDLAEELYQGLMRCLMKQERRAEAMAVYRRLRQVLSVTLGIQPSPQSEKLFQLLQSP